MDDDEITEVFYGFLSADLFNWPESEEDPNDYDEQASANAYADLVEERLHEEFPDADVSVEFQMGVSGALPWTLQTRINDDEHHPDIFIVENIAHDVYQEYTWAVKKKGD